MVSRAIFRFSPPRVYRAQMDADPILVDLPMFWLGGDLKGVQAQGEVAVLAAEGEVPAVLALGRFLFSEYACWCCSICACLSLGDEAGRFILSCLYQYFT
jgi:hypothetical protein